MNQKPNITSIRLYLVLTLANLIPILLVKYVPGLDLPNHVLAATLHTLPAADPRMEFFQSQWFCSPYMLFHLVMYPLLHLFGFLVSLQILLSLCVVAIPLSALFFMKVFNPHNWEWAFCSFLFVFTFHFEYGFIPYVLGIPLVLCGLALARLLMHGRFSARLLLATSTVTALVYLSHVINIFALMIGAVALAILREGGRDNSADDEHVGTLNKLGRLTLAFVPSIILLSVFILQLPDTGTSVGRALASMEYRSLFHQLQGPIRVFFSINSLLDLSVMGGIAGLILVLLVTKQSRVIRGVSFWLGSAIILVVLVLPRVRFLGGTDLSSRMAVFGILSLLSSLTLETKRGRLALITLMSVIVIANVTFRTTYYTRTSGMTDTFVRAVTSHIPPQQKVLTTYCGFPSAKLKPLLHAISWYHIEKGGYSPFLLFGNPAASGIATTVQLPALSEEWDDRDTLALRAVLPRYDFLVATTCGSPLPAGLSALPDSIVYRDSVCTIWKLSDHPGGH